MSRQNAPVTLLLKGRAHATGRQAAGAIAESLDGLVKVELTRVRRNRNRFNPTQQLLIEQMLRTIAARVGNVPITTVLNTEIGQQSPTVCHVAQQFFCPSKER